MNDTFNVPIIRLEIERMKQTILQALPQHAVAMDEAVLSAIERYCTPENLDVVISGEVMRVIDAAVKGEVREFFLGTGAGRAAIREAVEQHLNEWLEKSHD